MITDKRRSKLAAVAALRQSMTVILENVHDRHNIGAVMRTCDAVGIQEIYILNTEKHLQEKALEDVKSTSTGVRKWLDVHYYEDLDLCMEAVRKKYNKILGTHLDSDSKDLHVLDLTQNVAFLFGNEHDGISEGALKYCDGNFIIPQFGLVGSLNISVACAVTLYEACRQRKVAGLYDADLSSQSKEKQKLYERYLAIHNKRYQR